CLEGIKEGAGCVIKNLAPINYAYLIQNKSDVQLNSGFLIFKADSWTAIRRQLVLYAGSGWIFLLTKVGLPPQAVPSTITS
ncbi:MAG: hypothetical protein ACK4VV_15570, partial [Pseudomonas sp.]